MINAKDLPKGKSIECLLDKIEKEIVQLAEEAENQYYVQIDTLFGHEDKIKSILIESGFYVERDILYVGTHQFRDCLIVKWN